MRERGDRLDLLGIGIAFELSTIIELSRGEFEMLGLRKSFLGESGVHGFNVLAWSFLERMAERVMLAENSSIRVPAVGHSVYYHISCFTEPFS